MKRPMSVVFADAFDRAEYDVFVGPQVHTAFDEPAPSAWQNWVYWCRGFAAGLVNDHESKPLLMRVSNCAAWAGGRLKRLGSCQSESR